MLAQQIMIMVASAVTILTGAWVIGRFLVRRLEIRIDTWVNALIANSSAVRHLTNRIDVLEGTIGKG